MKRCRTVYDSLLPNETAIIGAQIRKEGSVVAQLARPAKKPATRDILSMTNDQLGSLASVEPKSDALNDRDIRAENINFLLQCQLQAPDYYNTLFPIIADVTVDVLGFEVAPKHCTYSG